MQFTTKAYSSPSVKGNMIFLMKIQLGHFANNIFSRFDQFDYPPLAPRHGFSYQQKLFLVNSRLKWVKDKFLDHAVQMEKDLKAVCILKDTIRKHPGGCLPIYAVSKRRRQLGLSIRVSSFLRKYPTIFEEFLGQEYSDLPWFGLTKEALDLDEEEQRIYKEHDAGSMERLCKLLMMTRQKRIPLQTIDQLKWDMGLPEDYVQSLVPRYPNYFSIVQLPDEREGLALVCWKSDFAVSALQKKSESEAAKFRSTHKEYVNNDNTSLISTHVKGGAPLAFPMNFMRGYGLKKKFLTWFEEWQRLPYISPYVDCSHLDPNSDISEKRLVGVFHELLNLTVHKKTDKKNLSNLRKCLGLPQKFPKVFTRHPGIFYLSQKCATLTVILREGYRRSELIEKHPLVSIREKYISMMRIGMLNRSRGLYKKKSLKQEDWDGDEPEQGLDRGAEGNYFCHDQEALSSESDSTQAHFDDSTCDEDWDFSEDEDKECLQKDHIAAVKRAMRASGQGVYGTGESRESRE